MNIFGLLDYTAQTFNVVKKQSQPSDRVASDFIKSKKSLGSNDRRFVFDLLFFVLRNLTLVEHISNNRFAINNSNVIALDFSKNDRINSKYDDLQVILTGFVLASFCEPFSNELSLENYINKKELSEYGSLQNAFLNSVTQYNVSTQDNLINWIESINNLFNLINLSLSSNGNSLSDFNTNAFDNISLRYSFPIYYINIILKYHDFSFENICKLADSFSKSAPITIRTSSRVKTIDNIITSLEQEGITAQRTSLSPSGLNISKRFYFNEHPLYKSGAIEIQDEASQMVAFALAPEENHIVLDACAGAGGKSLHIADLQNDSGIIIATDKEFNRLKEIPKRAANSGFKSIHHYLIDKNNKPKVDDGNIKFFNRRSFSAVLVDAPCSGTGTFRREPMKKYRITNKLIEKLSSIQYDILCNYSQYLNIGGTLLYATCSIMPEENDMVVEKFLEENPDFAPDMLENGFSKYNIKIDDLGDNWKYTFYPHIHGCDGFFIARMKKIS